MFTACNPVDSTEKRLKNNNKSKNKTLDNQFVHLSGTHIPLIKPYKGFSLMGFKVTIVGDSLPTSDSTP